MVALIVGIVVVVLAVVGWWVSEYYAKRRARYLTAEMVGWEDWDAPQRAAAANKTMCKIIEDIVAMRRAFLVFSIAVVAAGTWAVLSIQDTSDKAEQVVVELRETTCTFFRLQNGNVTEEIRQRQQRRDDLADQVIDMQEALASPPVLEEIPGYNELPEAAKTFLDSVSVTNRANAEADINDSKRIIGIYDEDLARLRAQVDEIRTLANSSSCP